MFFDEIKLSKKSWHFKLMKFTWGQNTPNLWSFCPYFWLTIFNLIILPFSLIIRGFQGFLNFLDRKLFIEPYNRFIEKNIEDELFIGSILTLEYKNDDIPRKSMFSKKEYFEITYAVNTWLEEKWGEDYWKKKDELYRKYKTYFSEKRKQHSIKNHEKEIEKSLKLEQREKERAIKEEKIKKFFEKIKKFLSPINNFFLKIANFFKKPDIYKIVKRTQQVISFLIVSAVILVIGYYLIIGAGHIYNFFKVEINWSWKYFSIGMLFGLEILSYSWIAIFSIALLVLALKKLINWIKEKEFEVPNSIEITFKFLKSITVKPFIFLIIKPLSFFILYFKAVKNDNCPAIIWEDENENNN